MFCNRKTDVDIVSKSLKKYGYDAAPIHGDLDQSKRTETLEKFRNGELKLLVASDVAARGLDVPSVSHVFNFDVPSHSEDYVHRIGRTGRAGRDGKAIMICEPRDEKNFDGIEKLIAREIPRIEDPRPKKEPVKKSKPEKSEQAVEETPIVDVIEPREDAKPAKSRSRRGGEHRTDNKVIGLGDHLPSFIALSFEERRAG